MADKARNKGQQCLRYKMEKSKRVGTFDILNNISKHVTLVQLMASLGFLVV